MNSYSALSYLQIKIPPMRERSSNFRAYFKNDLYGFSLPKMKKTSNSNAKPEQPQIQQQDNGGQMASDPKQYLEINFDLQPNKAKDEEEELRQILSSEKFPQQVSKRKKNPLYTPKNTLKEPKKEDIEIKEKETKKEKEKKAQSERIEMWKMRKELEKKKQEREPSEKSSSGEKKITKTGKKKKIKKEENFVRINMKQKYKDKFVGALRQNLRMYTRNGKLKSKYKKQSEFEIENGELYNSYIVSLSRALYFTIDLDDEEQVSNQHIAYEIPTEFNHESLLSLTHTLFGFESFREGQYETIFNTLSGKSTLFVSETASGKSLTYLLSSIVLKGLSIVISPLVSLMLDQLEHLPSDLPAACISSLLNRQNKEKIFKMVKEGKIQLLFMTPESLLIDLMPHLKSFPPINFVCIDQAHCLSELSHSFRPSYLSLIEIVLKHFQYKKEEPVVLCLTATANQEMSDSIMAKLKIKEKIRSSTIINKNLFITISREHLTSKYEALLKYLAQPQISQCKGILVYSRTKKIMFEVHNYLKNSGISCSFYHSNLSQKQKTDILANFREGVIRIVISTIALGMGLDFENLECVVHMNMPKSVENYIQEIGRAGRRKKRGYCHLFLDTEDYFTERNYLLGDELDQQILDKIIKKLKENRKVRQSETQKGLKRLSIRVEDEEEGEEGEDQIQQGSNGKENCKGLSYCKTAVFEDATVIKQDVILKILLKMQEILGTEVFQIYHTSYQMLKIGFYKKNQQSLSQESEFFRSLTNGAKTVKGNLYINLIVKCNELKMTPIEVLKNIHHIAAEAWLKIELVNEVFVWKHVISEAETIKRMKEEKTAQQLIQSFNQMQRVALTKLNILYSLCFNHSRKSMSNIIESQEIIGDSEELPPKTISEAFDNYFQQETVSLYKHITKEGCLENEAVEEAAELPITSITGKDKTEIYQSVMLFFKHLISSSLEKDFVKVVKPFRDGKIISKVFLGVNDSQSSWKVYGQHSYWMRFKQKNYVDLMKEVKACVKKYIEEEGIKYLVLGK